MKRFLFVAVSICLFACSNETATVNKTDEAKTTGPQVALPFKMAYTGAPSIGKTENIAKVMNFNGDFIAGKMDSIGNYFADSVHLVFEDGKIMDMARDSLAAMVKALRASMTGAKQAYYTAIAVDNKEKGDEWVFQWIDESHDYKNGKKEHFFYHEDYLLKNGKIREFYQYAQAVPEKK